MKQQTWQQTITTITRKHEEWLRMACYFTGSVEDGREVLQRVYFQLCEIGNREGNLKRIVNGKGQAVPYYMFSAIRNQAIKYSKQKQAQVRVNQVFENQLAELHKADQEEKVDKQQLEKMLTTLEDEIQKLYWYDRQVLRIYLYEQGSIRRMAKATKISQYSLYNTLTNIKNKLKTCVKKD